MQMQYTVSGYRKFNTNISQQVSVESIFQIDPLLAVSRQLFDNTSTSQSVAELPHPYRHLGGKLSTGLYCGYSIERKINIPIC